MNSFPAAPACASPGLPDADAHQAFSIEAEFATALEHLHLSIGQRARWAIVAIRERVERERAVMDRASHWSRPGVQAWLRGPNRLFDPLFRGDQ